MCLWEEIFRGHRHVGVGWTLGSSRMSLTCTWSAPGLDINVFEYITHDWMSTSPRGPSADTFTGTGRRHFRCRRDKQVVSFGFSHPGDQQQWMGYVAEILYLMCTHQKIIVPDMYVCQCQCVLTWGLGNGSRYFSLKLSGAGKA